MKNAIQRMGRPTQMWLFNAISSDWKSGYLDLVNGAENIKHLDISLGKNKDRMALQWLNKYKFSPRAFVQTLDYIDYIDNIYDSYMIHGWVTRAYVLDTVRCWLHPQSGHKRTIRRPVGPVPVLCERVSHWKRTIPHDSCMAH